MGNPRFARKQGFKMLRPHKESGKNMRGKRHRKDVIEHIPSLSDSGDTPKEHSNVDYEEEAGAKEEEVAYKEPTTYDHLLKMLSGSESFAKAYKKRQREEGGKSDTEEDSVSGFSSSKEEDDSDEGTDKESPRILDMKGSDLAGEHIDNVGHEDEGFSEIDEASDLEANGQLVDSALKASVSMSSFSDHLGHKLSQTEVDNLSKRKWKCKWQMPASDMLNCKWMGTGECLTKDVDLSSVYSLKQRLYKHWLDIYEASGGNDFDLSKQRNFFSLFNSYRDILHHNKKPFYLKGLEEDSNVMDAYLMHSLNHIFRSADLVTKNNAKVAKHQESADGYGFLDQGFTRPKVLILLPLASIAYRVIKRLIQLIPPADKVNVEKLDHFIEKFGAGVADNSDDNEDDVIGNLKSDKTSKPSDFQALFGGNNEDHFMIGIKFTRGRITFSFVKFHTSDMIIASPLGLVTKIGKAQVDKGTDVDYLSSIEVLIIDHADVIAMQNWSHVNTVVEKLNQKPSKQHGTDIMRIRQWFYEGHAQFYRQTIILGAYSNPDINGLFNHHCVNYQGKVKLVCEHKGVLPKVLLQVRQVYERFDAESAVDVDDARLEYFARKVFPKIKDSIQGGIMLFISSYFEFVRLRNFLKSQDASFCLLGEYTKQADISRARVWFYQGTRKIMLYTERAHFYHRYKIRGIQNLIIYSLPERKEFYPEVVNMLEGSHGMTCTVLFSRFDQLRLERIVGTAPAKRMATSEKGVFTFC